MEAFSVFWPLVIVQPKLHGSSTQSTVQRICKNTNIFNNFFKLFIYLSLIFEIIVLQKVETVCFIEGM